ncbi:hypothetical protein [Pseudomonas koreensis]|uniref:hypothetical protein n=1 Tax=Pseudomonas koreensis TaxID=198620 RepID=UPI0009F3B263|nr:hypothetical protein [Pseudomonas koreensis]KAB0510934.1 hypothetical protein F7R05_22305 [Pseudomonas koreensis]NNA64317.1 hypothetical protein [Pseudomonas koreensis]GGK46040.1 hypothetical protein GCM10009103_45830 [Pseudomonas koreensis]
MDRETEAQIGEIFEQICIAADARQVTHSSVGTDDEHPARRQLIVKGLRDRLYRKYPKSLVLVDVIASGTITVSITHP